MMSPENISYVVTVFRSTPSQSIIADICRGSPVFQTFPDYFYCKNQLLVHPLPVSAAHCMAADAADIAAVGKAISRYSAAVAGAMEAAPFADSQRCWLTLAVARTLVDRRCWLPLAVARTLVDRRCWLPLAVARTMVVVVGDWDPQSHSSIAFAAVVPIVVAGWKNDLIN
jgi:hypothetical protein